LGVEDEGRALFFTTLRAKARQCDENGKKRKEKEQMNSYFVLEQCKEKKKKGRDSGFVP